MLNIRLYRRIRNPKSKYYKENKKPWPKMMEQLKQMKLFKRNNNGKDSRFEDKGSTNESHYVFYYW